MLVINYNKLKKPPFVLSSALFLWVVHICGPAFQSLPRATLIWLSLICICLCRSSILGVIFIYVSENNHLFSLWYSVYFYFSLSLCNIATRSDLIIELDLLQLGYLVLRRRPRARRWKRLLPISESGHNLKGNSLSLLSSFDIYVLGVIYLS